MATPLNFLLSDGDPTAKNPQLRLARALAHEPFSAERVLEALQQGADLNRPLPSFGYGLFEAVWAGDAERTRWLLTQGADPNQICRADFHHRPRQTQWTALLAAAVQDRLDLVTMLLQHGADPTRLTRGKTLLHELFRLDHARQLLGMDEGPAAKAKRYHKITQVLIDAGAPTATTVYPKKTYGLISEIDSPLMGAATRGFLKAVVLLVELGVEMDIFCGAYPTPLMMAIMWGERDTAEYLWRAGASPHAPDHRGVTPYRIPNDNDTSNPFFPHYGATQAWFRALVDAEGLQQDLAVGLRPMCARPTPRASRARL